MTTRMLALSTLAISLMVLAASPSVGEQPIFGVNRHFTGEGIQLSGSPVEITNVYAVPEYNQVSGDAYGIYECVEFRNISDATVVSAQFKFAHLASNGTLVDAVDVFNYRTSEKRSSIPFPPPLEPGMEARRKKQFDLGKNCRPFRGIIDEKNTLFYAKGLWRRGQPIVLLEAWPTKVTFADGTSWIAKSDPIN